MVKITHLILYLVLVSFLGSCGQAINVRGSNSPAGASGNQNPNNNLPQSQVNWDAESMSGSKSLRIIPID